MSTKDIVILVAVGVMALGPILLWIERLHSGRGIGARAIQFCAVVMIIPVILILSLVDILSKETSATLIGALTGYLLSGVGSFDPSGVKKNKEQPADLIKEDPESMR